MILSCPLELQEVLYFTSRYLQFRRQFDGWLANDGEEVTSDDDIRI